MAKSSSSKLKLSKVVITAKRSTNCLEVFRGYGLLSHKGVVLEAYLDDFQYTLGKLKQLNSYLHPSRRSKLVRVVAVIEKLCPREIQQIARKSKKNTKGE